MRFRALETGYFRPWFQINHIGNTMFLTSVNDKRRNMDGVPKFKIHHFCGDSYLLGLKCTRNSLWHKVITGFRILFQVLRHRSTAESRREVYMMMKNYSAYPNNDNKAKLLIKKETNFL